jgi:hypothetical protein
VFKSGLSVCVDPHAPDGFVAFSFAGDDWRFCRDHIHERLGIAHQPQKPNQHAAMRPPPLVIEAQRLREMIAGIFRELVPLRRTPGERYLAEGRKIDTAAITDVLERADAIEREAEARRALGLEAHPSAAEPSNSTTAPKC